MASTRTNQKTDALVEALGRGARLISHNATGVRGAMAKGRRLTGALQTAVRVHAVYEIVCVDMTAERERERDRSQAHYSPPVQTVCVNMTGIRDSTLFVYTDQRKSERQRKKRKRERVVRERVRERERQSEREARDGQRQKSGHRAAAYVRQVSCTFHRRKSKTEQGEV